ncbi:MAG: glycerophosphodiester phosphodiesterase [Clostridiales bacterium]|nr:glycerophosphodiester phosphodiesterase [Clostridiales bacterium]
MQVIYGHRGASGYAPENTLEAFELAAKMGATGVELDVHIARDGELVVTHDEKIDRVAFGSGLVADMTTAELKKIKFNRTHPEYEHATIPTLREVYELLKPYGLKVNAELKNSIIDYPNLEEKCIKLAYETGMTDNVLYSSFNHYSMLRVKKIDPKLPVGLLYECMLIDPWDYAKKLGADAIHPHFSELQVPGEAEKTHALGMAVNVWTVNEEKDIRFSIEAGADIIISNYPDVAIKVLGEHQK